MTFGFNEAVALAEMQQQGVQQAGSDGLRALFYERPIKNDDLSEKEGRPVFEAHDFVRILIPGDNKSVPDRAVKEEDKRRWPEAWEAYKNKERGKIIGMPLKEWAFLTATRCAELNALGLHTVEEIAGITDAHVGRLGADGRKLRERAQQHLQQASDTEKQLREEVAAYKDALDNAMTRIETLERQANEKRRPGRPRKDAA